MRGEMRVKEALLYGSATFLSCAAPAETIVSEDARPEATVMQDQTGEPERVPDAPAVVEREDGSVVAVVNLEKNNVFVPAVVDMRGSFQGWAKRLKDEATSLAQKVKKDVQAGCGEVDQRGAIAWGLHPSACREVLAQECRADRDGYVQNFTALSLCVSEREAEQRMAIREHHHERFRALTEASFSQGVENGGTLLPEKGRFGSLNRPFGDVFEEVTEFQYGFLEEETIPANDAVVPVVEDTFVEERDEESAMASVTEALDRLQQVVSAEVMHVDYCGYRWQLAKVEDAVSYVEAVSLEEYPVVVFKEAVPAEKAQEAMEECDSLQGFFDRVTEEDNEKGFVSPETAAEMKKFSLYFELAPDVPVE